MGLFSKLKETVNNVNTVAGSMGKSTVIDYGEPEYTLYTALDWKDMHRKIEITDEAGQDGTGQSKQKQKQNHCKI